MSDVLVLRALGLGDALTAVPALRALRRAFPPRRLVLAAPAGIGRWLVTTGVTDGVLDVAGLGDAAALHRLDGAPEVAVDLHGRGPQSHRLLQMLGAARLLAFRCPEAGHLTGPEWDPDEHEVDRWLRLAAWAGGDGSPQDLRLQPPGPRSDHVVIHPGAAHPSRQWPAERWAAVARALRADGHRIVVTGGPGEEALVDAVADGVDADVLAGRQDLHGLARTVGTAALLLSGDTGVAHLATAFGTSSVTLFGPVSPALWGPRIDAHLHVALWTGDPAVPRPGEAEGAALDARLAAIDVGGVLDAARDLLGRAAHTLASPSGGRAQATVSSSPAAGT